MTNFKFTQAHIDRLAEAGVKWAKYTDNQYRPLLYVNTDCCNLSLTPRALLVGTATDLFEGVYKYRHVQLYLYGTEAIMPSMGGRMYEAHPTQEENLIDLIVDLSAKLLKAKPPVSFDAHHIWRSAVNERLERIEKKVGI